MPQSSHVLKLRRRDRGDGKTDTFTHALTISCNTAFAELGVNLGAQKIKDQAAEFGITARASKCR